MNRLDRAMNVMRNLPKMAIMTEQKTGMQTSEDLRNRALKAIDIIRKYKGLDVFLNALNKLEKNVSDKINILIVGECYESYEKYKKICQNSNISIKWFNEYIPDDKISIYFSASDYVVLPYRSASQSGIIPMAYHYNLPVIISDLYSLKKNVINNKTGLVFENENYNQLSEIISDITMNKISNDYNYIEEYKNNFTTTIFVEKLISLMK